MVDLRAQLHEVEAENRDLKYVVDVGTNFDPGTALARLHKLQEETVTNFRQRAIEAVRARFGREGILAQAWNRSDAEFDAAVAATATSTLEDELVALLQSLPVTSEVNNETDKS